MSYLKFTRLFYLFQFFQDFILVFAVDKLLFLHRGLDLTQISVLVAFWSGLTILLEVPTGALADRWSRRKILVISGVFYGLGYLTWLFSSSFWPFLLGFVFRTIGGTLNSGTLEAYVYDFLKLKGREDDFEKVWGRGFTLQQTGAALALAIGGALSSVSYELVLVFSALSPLVTSVIALLMPEVKPVISSGRSYLSFLGGGVKRAFSNPALVWVFVYFATVGVSLGVLDEYHQVLMSDWLGLSNSFIGLWLAVSFGAGAVSAFFAHRMKQRGRPLLYLLAAITAVMLTAILLFKSVLLIIILPMLYIFMSLMVVLLQGIIQREIATEERATITSVNSLLSEVSAIVMYLVAFGLIADRLGIQAGYGVIGLVIVAYLAYSAISQAVKSMARKKGASNEE